MFRRLFLALLSFAFSLPGWACMPPTQGESAGFVRPDLGRLPKNALGVMFNPPGDRVSARDFQVSSAQDKRLLAVRVREFGKNIAWVRLELAGGFQPGASYTFRYLPRHGDWEYPDRMSVAIDDAIVSTDGPYALALEPRPRHRAIRVPTSSGECFAPSAAMVREFAHTVPPALAPYADALHYEDYLAPVAGRGPAAASLSDGWRSMPTLYERFRYSLGGEASKHYSMRNNAVVVACGVRAPLMRLSSSVTFPELDFREHRLPAVDIDMNRDVAGQCSQLDALLASLDPRAPETGLRELCRNYLFVMYPMSDLGMRGTQRAAFELDEWKRALSFFRGMSPTCTLTGLAHLWHTGRYRTDPPALHQLGTALGEGIGGADAPTAEAAIHALGYLVDQLPPRTGPASRGTCWRPSSRRW
ncbi:hypothetical protein [Massilia sp. Se16.2.3]|uniref:hypothetical protein n=1 Tax=Massilia sp. Se16.2.3 TaxID=2709303 RepID=UPI0016038CDC|nr:hypothetical protein [Massilia sp. Se16.2.3]QNB00475.1 hypothetical protein G4G31_19425 [Massilia sp. Se16.2.3]